MINTAVKCIYTLPSQETGLKVNQEASFAVQLNGARGMIDAKVHTPSGAVEECYITELDNGEHSHAHTTHIHLQDTLE